MPSNLVEGAQCFVQIGDQRIQRVGILQGVRVDVMLERRSIGVEQIELQLHPHLGGVAESGQPSQHPLEHGPRVEQGWVAVVRNDIRDDVTDSLPPGQRPERGEVGYREHVRITAVPVGQAKPVDDGAVGVPAQRGFTEGESDAAGPIEELSGGYPLALGVAERITPCHLDFGERAVGEPPQQVALGC